MFKRTIVATALLGILAAPAFGQGIKLNAFPSASALSSGDLVPVGQGGAGTTYKSTVGAFSSYVLNSGGLGGDCTITALSITCTKTGGVLFGTFATQGYASPPIIGATTPNVGHFSTLSATGLLSTAASGTGSAGLNLPQGAAPTSPNNGDVWVTTAGMFVRANGTTVGPLSAGGSGGVTIGAAISGSCVSGYNLYSNGGVIACQPNGGGGGTVSTTGSPVSGNLTKFSAASTITNGDLTGAVTTSGTLATTLAANAVATSNITNANVTYAKVQNVAASRLLCNPTGSPAAPSECALGSGLAFNGTNVAPSAPYTANTANASIGSLSGLDVFNGSSLTATLPNTSTLGANATAAVLNVNSSPLTITNGQTPTGVPLSTTLHQFGWIQYLGTGSAAYAVGFPGFGTITSGALMKFTADATGASTAGDLSGDCTTSGALVTTCPLKAAVLATGTSVSLTAPRQYYVCTSTCTVTPPVPAAGYEFCVLNGDAVTTVITLAAIGTSARYEATARTAYGTAGTGTLVSGGAAADKVCIVGLDSTHYLTVSYNGTWTAN